MDRFDRDDDALESKEGFRRAVPRRGGVDEMPLLPSFMMCFCKSFLLGALYS